MKKGKGFKILKDLLNLQTAAFREDHVLEYIRSWARKKGVPLSFDEAGNLFLSYEGAGASKDLCHWVFAAHMDHPSFVVRQRRGKKVWADFRGGVREEYFPGSRVIFYPKGARIAAKIVSAQKSKDLGWWICRLELEEESSLPRGTIGMWDLPDYKKRGHRISARTCDDLAGVAAILDAFELIVEEQVPARVSGLLTRAEEVGFMGAIAACRLGSIPSDASILAIETSAEQSYARLGDGVIIRVGDKTWSFDPPLTYFVEKVARKLKEEDESFGYLRRLMPGGTCESTPYSVFGYQSTGLCLALGNYHNMGAEGRIASEKIDGRDYTALVSLLLAVAREKSTARGQLQALKRRLSERFQRRKAYLM